MGHDLPPRLSLTAIDFLEPRRGIEDGPVISSQGSAAALIAAVRT